MIHGVTISFDYKVRDYKLIGTIQWGLTFNMATSYTPSSYEWLNANMVQFKVVNDEIVSTKLKGFFNY